MRLFLAVDLPEEVRRALAACQERLRATEAGWRWVRPEGVHVTLRFLGEVAEARLPELSARWRAAAAAGRPAELTATGLGTFPPRGRPRVLWVGLHDGRGGNLAALAGQLEREAREAGFPPEERPFAPHLTLARAAAGEAPRRPGPAVAELGSFPAAEVTLFRSVPGRGGAIYTALERYPVGRDLP